MINCLSFDVEDWQEIVHWKVTGERIPPSTEAVESTDEILQTLGEADVRATFFVLASVAKRYPELVQRIAEAGHEVGSHGYSHMLVYRQSPKEFRQETRRSKEMLEDITGMPVLGYRAAEFSITRSSWWALEILAELGFRYDSSVYPISGSRYGVPASPLSPYVIRTAAGRIVEIPLTAVEWLGRRWPVGGGGYFRLLPYRATASALRRVNESGRAAVVYLHPYEFTRRKLRIAAAPTSLQGLKMLLRNTIVHNLARDRPRHRFARLLREFQFHPMQELISDGERHPEILEFSR